MQRALGLVLLAVAGTVLTGCPAVVALMDPPQKRVVAVYPGLPGHRLAVVVHTMESTEMEYPFLADNLARFVATELNDKVSNLTFVPEAVVAKYKSDNYYWGDTPPAEIGQKLGAEMILFLNVDFYSPSQPGEMNFMQGRLTCSCSLTRVGGGERGTAEWGPRDLTVQWPPKEYGGSMSLSAKQTQTQLLSTFSQKLAWNFYNHNEELADD